MNKDQEKMTLTSILIRSNLDYVYHLQLNILGMIKLV